MQWNCGGPWLSSCRLLERQLSLHRVRIVQVICIISADSLPAPVFNKIEAENVLVREPSSLKLVKQPKQFNLNYPLNLGKSNSLGEGQRKEDMYLTPSARVKIYVPSQLESSN